MVPSICCRKTAIAGLLSPLLAISSVRTTRKRCAASPCSRKVPEHYALWKHLPAMIRDGKQNAFIREFGRMAFEHAAHDPDYAGVFNDAMSSYSSSQTVWALEALDA